LTLTLLSSGIAGLALLLLYAAGPLYEVGALSLASAFTVLRWAAYLGIATMAVSLVTGGLAYRRAERLGVWLAGVTFIAGIVAFGIPFQWQRSARGTPPIHDISTDLENPPTFSAVVAHRASGVLFVIAADTTSRQAAQTALDQLEHAHARFLGAVLNRVDVERDSYYYSRYYRKDYANYYSAAN
jgi:hypothetical protein